MINYKGQVDAVLLDFSKEFDKVSYERFSFVFSYLSNLAQIKELSQSDDHQFSAWKVIWSLIHWLSFSSEHFVLGASLGFQICYINESKEIVWIFAFIIWIDISYLPP